MAAKPRRSSPPCSRLATRRSEPLPGRDPTSVRFFVLFVASVVTRHFLTTEGTESRVPAEAEGLTFDKDLRSERRSSTLGP